MQIAIASGIIDVAKTPGNSDEMLGNLMIRLAVISRGRHHEQRDQMNDLLGGRALKLVLNTATS
jgi:hypothetical protein